MRLTSLFLLVFILVGTNHLQAKRIKSLSQKANRSTAASKVQAVHKNEKDTIKVQTLSIDFKDPKNFRLENVSSIKRGQLYQIEIDNINLNIYNVAIGKKDSLIISDVQFPTFELIGADAINNVIDGINIATSSTSIPAVNLLDEATLKSGEKIKVNLFGEKIVSDPFEISKITSSLDSKWVEDYEEIVKAIYAVKAKEKIKIEIATNQQTIKNILSDANADFENADDLIFDVNLQALSYLEGLGEPKLDGILKGRKARTLQEIVRDSDTARGAIRKIRSALEKLDADYKKFKESDPAYAKEYEDAEIKKQDATLNSDLSKAKETVNTILEKISPTKISEYLTSIMHLDNNNSRKYVSMPFQHNGDISDLTITISPKKPEYGQSYTMNYKFPIDKIYIGLSGAFYYANFKHESYSIKEIPTSDSTSVFSLVDEENRRGEVGFAVLLHVGYKIGNNGFGVHGTVGPGLSIANKPLPRIAGGGGLSFGKRNGMISLDLLCIAGNVNVKSNVFNDDNYQPIIKPESPTVSKLKTTWGLSLGYIYKF